MTDIARTQFFLMVKMQRRGSLSYDSLNDSGKDDLNFLKSKGYVRISRPASPGTSACYSVTAAGRAALYAFRSTFFEVVDPRSYFCRVFYRVSNSTTTLINNVTSDSAIGRSG